MRSLFQKLKYFIDVNIWVEKVHVKALGWFYALEVFYSLYSRLMQLLDTFFIAQIINSVLSHIGNPTVTLQLLQFPVVMLLLNRLLIRILNSQYYEERYIRRNFAFEQYFTQALINKMDELNWEHIESPETEKHLNMTFNRSRGNMEDLSKMHIDFITILITLIFTLATIHIAWWIYLIILIKELPSIILHSKWNTDSYRISDRLLPRYQQLGAISYYFRHFPTLFEVKLTRAADQLTHKKDIIVENIRTAHEEHNKKIRIPQIFMDVYETVINTGLYFYYVLQVIYNGMELGTFQYSTTAVQTLGNNIYGFISRIPQSIEAYRYIRYAYDILRLRNTTPNGTLELKSEKITIEFKDVWFKYPFAHKYALKGVSFKINDNDRIALVGENGAGKSTFLKLLMLVYYPTKGEILINGIRVQEYDKKSIYRALSLVTQEFSRYESFTVRDNIAITESGKTIDDKKVAVAARLAEADGFIAKLKNKYDTLLTKQLPDGTELSSGQWQRLAIARQFYSDRPLIVLDEPTSAIDPIAEAKIFTNLYEHVKNKTVIVVSHRYNTVRAAKNILVFNDGQIIEQGTHEELLAMNGYYAKAFEVQHEVKKL